MLSAIRSDHVKIARCRVELRQCGRWDVSIYLVVKNVGMLSIAEEKKKINAATLKQFFGVTCWCGLV